MPANTAITDEAEIHIMNYWASTLAATDLVFYAVIVPLIKPLNEYTYSDVATITHPGVRSTLPPVVFGPALGLTSSLDSYPYVTFVNWKFLNNSGSTKTVYGLCVVDEDNEKMLLIFPTFATLTMPNGAEYGYDVTFWMNATNDFSPS